MRRLSAVFTVLTVLCGAPSGCSSETDWSVEVVESTMVRFPGEDLPGWSYPIGLYLYGQYLVYQRTGAAHRLEFIQNWVDRHVDRDGEMDQEFDTLDSMMPGRLLVALHRETGDPRYAKAAAKIRDRLGGYPRTTDGGFWHSVRQVHQLWADGTFMVNPFLAEYGREFDDEAYAYDEALHQLEIYADHLQQPDGILRHAYDEKREQAWANLESGLAPETWCRAMGWFAVATVHILEITPEDHPRRDAVLAILEHMASGLEKYQDPETGLWWEVVDRGDRMDNWTETSCSSMYTFTLSRAAEMGWIDPSYAEVAERGYEGVLTRISLDDKGMTTLEGTVVGTNVGDYRYYVDRPRRNDDFHGLGAFLIMNEQMRRVRGQ